jgi:hypothetical protein
MDAAVAREAAAQRGDFSWAKRIVPAFASKSAEAGAEGNAQAARAAFDFVVDERKALSDA